MFAICYDVDQCILGNTDLVAICTGTYNWSNKDIKQMRCIGMKQLTINDVITTQGNA